MFASFREVGVHRPGGFAACVQAFGPNVVTVDVTFRNGDAPGTGRQSQLWVRMPDGWKIVRAHVSMI